MPRFCAYYHRDFDGVVSAALVLRWFKKEQQAEVNELRAVDYGEPWSERQLTKPNVVVDFLYHPDATYFWDHHSSPFLSSKWSSHYEERKKRKDTVWWDPARPSCASLIADTLPSLDLDPDVSELVQWATRIDAARYSSVDQVFAAEAPALQLNLALVSAPDDFYASVVRLLVENPLHSAAKSPDIQSRTERARLLQRRELEHFQEQIHSRDLIVSADTSDRILYYSRYAPYYFLPNAFYSVVLHREVSGYKILCMRNPWREFDSLDLAGLCRPYGGGGHPRVAAIRLKREDKELAKRILLELEGKLNEHAKSVRETVSEPV
jgi:nanoRNase/pAp phosphatase (c-di-AMP/oligoRNAs hydrolase)